MEPPAYNKEDEANNQPSAQQGGYPSSDQQGAGYPPVQQGGYPPTGQPAGYPPPSQAVGYPPPGKQDFYPVGGQSVGYYPQPGSQTVIVQQQASPPMQDQGRIQCLLGLSIFATLCCNLLCGIPAIILAVMAMGNHDASSRQSQSKCSMILSIVAIVSGVILIIGVIVFYVLFLLSLN